MNIAMPIRISVWIILASTLMFLQAGNIFAQLSGPGRPYPLEYNGAPLLKVYEPEVTETQRRQAVAGHNTDNLKPANSGLSLSLGISPVHEGAWDTLAGGIKIWRAAVHIKGATLLNLTFNPYNLRQGVKIFLYDTLQHTVLGSFTHVNNKANGLLATAQITGDFLVVEMQVPEYISSYGSLSVASVGCDFDNAASGQLKDGWFGTSGTCNIDINCLTDTLSRITKQAVVRIVFNGTSRCTGSLVNNTLNDGRNYILTAEHCINDEDAANSAVFYFDYESPFCDGPDGNSSKSISGSTLRATGNTLDFTLLELLEPIPFAYQPYYAGWDRSGTPPSSGVSIHHPRGDVKKISRENHALVVANFGSNYETYTHFRVRHWETGTTEEGSSGAPFFDPSGRIAGTLTGGLANCTSPIFDYYQMLSHAWSDYANQNRQLKYWLDPSGSNPLVFNGYYPNREFWLSGDTLSNMLPGEDLTVLHEDLAWGSYSGHNSDHLGQFAEQYFVSDKKNVLGVLMDVADNHLGHPSDYISVKVWQGGLLPGQVIFEQNVLLSELTDNTLNFIEFDSAITVTDTFFTGYEVYYNLPADTFSTFMAENRTANLVNTAFVHDGFSWHSLEDYTEGAVHSSFAIMPLVYDTLPSAPHPVEITEKVIAYPNPAGSEITLTFREIPTTPVEVTLVNVQGQVIYKNEYSAYQQTILLDRIYAGTGIYFLSIRNGDTVFAPLKIALIK